MKNLIAKAQNYASMKLAGVKTEEGSQLIEVLGTIIVAVVLLILFKDKIKSLFNNTLTTTDESVTNLFK